MPLFYAIVFSAALMFFGTGVSYAAGSAETQTKVVFFSAWEMSQTDILSEVCEENGYKPENYLNEFKKTALPEIQKNEKLFNSMSKQDQAEAKNMLAAMKPGLKQQVLQNITGAVEKAKADGVKTSVLDVCQKLDQNPAMAISENSSAMKRVSDRLFNKSTP